MCQALLDAAEAPPPGFCRHVDFEVEGGRCPAPLGLGKFHLGATVETVF